MKCRIEGFTQSGPTSDQAIEGLIRRIPEVVGDHVTSIRYVEEFRPLPREDVDLIDTYSAGRYLASEYRVNLATNKGEVLVYKESHGHPSAGYFRDAILKSIADSICEHFPEVVGASSVKEARMFAKAFSNYYLDEGQLRQENPVELERVQKVIAQLEAK